MASVSSRRASSSGTAADGGAAAAAHNLSYSWVGACEAFDQPGGPLERRMLDEHAVDRAQRAEHDLFDVHTQLLQEQRVVAGGEGVPLMPAAQSFRGEKLAGHRDR